MLVNDEILQVGEQLHVLDARRQISASLIYHLEPFDRLKQLQGSKSET